jgi:hypothetical protein
VAFTAHVTLSPSALTLLTVAFVPIVLNYIPRERIDQGSGGSSGESQGSGGAAATTEQLAGVGGSRFEV